MWEDTPGYIKMVSYFVEIDLSISTGPGTNPHPIS